MLILCCFFFFKQKTAYEMRISDWSSDVCSSDLDAVDGLPVDVVFVLLSPSDCGADHLKALARVSRYLRDERQMARLRGAGSDEALFALLAGSETRDAA